MPGGIAARADADAIELADVTKAFGGLTALAGVSLSLPHRSRTGIVGPSGGGKTTLLQIIAGLLQADTGLVRVGDAVTAQQRLTRCRMPPDSCPGRALSKPASPSCSNSGWVR